MSEEQQGDDPASIAKWVAEFGSIPPLEMSAHDEAESTAWRKRMKEFNLDAVRRQFEGDATGTRL
jgi:hypothetical protein